MPESNTKYNTITNLRNNLTPKNPTNGKNYIISLCDVSDQLQIIYLTNKASLLIHPFSQVNNCQNKFNNQNILYTTISGQNISCHSCMNNETSSFNNVNIQRKIQNQVSVQSSEYSMNLASLNINSNNLSNTKKPWNNQSDRELQHGKKSQINSSIPANYGVDIKHNSYDRYLGRKKSQYLKTESLPTTNIVPMWGNKTRKYGIINCIKSC